MIEKLKNSQGFTLIELMVAIGLSVVVGAFVFNVYSSQNESYVIQDRVVEMQQNLRSGIDIMAREIRMCGYDPTGLADAAILVADDDRIRITMDSNEDGAIGAPEEEIEYLLVAGGGDIPALHRNDINGVGSQPLAMNIVAVGFAYAVDGNADGELDTDAGGVIWAVPNSGKWMDLDTNDDGKIDSSDSTAGQNTGISVNLAEIRAVRLWLLACSDNQDEEFTNHSTYVVGNRHITPAADGDPNNDNRRMRILERILKCRNVGL